MHAITSLHHHTISWNLAADIPQSEISATSVAEVRAKNWAKSCTNFLGHFRASFAVQNDPKFLSIHTQDTVVSMVLKQSFAVHSDLQQ